MGNEKIKIITISAKNSETVEFRKFNSIEGNDAVYDENGSFSKQLSTNCGVFVFDINEKKNEKLMVIVTPQYKVDFSNIKGNSLSTEVKEINSQKELLFFNKDNQFRHEQCYHYDNWHIDQRILCGVPNAFPPQFIFEQVYIVLYSNKYFLFQRIPIVK